MAKNIIGSPSLMMEKVEHNYLTSYKLILKKHIREVFEFTDTRGYSDDDVKKFVSLKTCTAVPIPTKTFEWISSMFQFVYDKDNLLVYDNKEGIWKFERDEQALVSLLTDYFTTVAEEATKANDRLQMAYAFYFFSTPQKIGTLAKRILGSVHLRIDKSKDLVDSVENYRYFKGEDGKRYLLDISKSTYDLKQVSLNEIQPMHLMYLSPIPISTNDQEPKLWLELIDEYMMHDPDRIEYFKKVLAYLMAPYNYNQVYIYLYGAVGRNGKSTVLKVIQDILGPHAARCNADLLNANPPANFKRDDALAACEGKSVIIFNEVEDRMMANTRNIKELTEGGRDQYGNKIFTSVRPSYSKTYDVCICGTPVIAANSLLNFNEWNMLGPLFKRLIIVPFDYKIIKEDPTIPSRLAAEYPQIQAWLYRNYFKYYGIRLKEEPKPADFDALFNAYKDDSDLLGTFWRTCIVVTGNDADHLRKSGLYAAYRAFCLSNGRQAIKNVGTDGFSNLIKSYVSNIKLSNLSNVMTYQGIKLSDEFKANCENKL